MYVWLFIPFPTLHTSKMSVSTNYASKMTLMIDLQICKAHDVTATLDLQCDSQKWIIVHQLLCKLPLLVDVSGAQLLHAAWCLVSSHSADVQIGVTEGFHTHGYPSGYYMKGNFFSARGDSYGQNRNQCNPLTVLSHFGGVPRYLSIHFNSLKPWI